MKHILAILVFVLGTGIASAGQLNVTLSDLLLLVESGVSDKTILAFIEPRKITFTLGRKEIAKMYRAGISDEVIQYLLAKNKRTGLTYNRYIKPPVPYSYPRYYYGSSLYLGFGRGHHALFGNHYVGLHHSAPQHTGLHHGAGTASTHSINNNHRKSGSSVHISGLNSHRNGISHSALGSSSHNTSSSSAHSTNYSSSYSGGHSSSHSGAGHSSGGHGGGH